MVGRGNSFSASFGISMTLCCKWQRFKGKLVHPKSDVGFENDWTDLGFAKFFTGRRKQGMGQLLLSHYFRYYFLFYYVTDDLNPDRVM